MKRPKMVDTKKNKIKCFHHEFKNQSDIEAVRSVEWKTKCLFISHKVQDKEVKLCRYCKIETLGEQLKLLVAVCVSVCACILCLM